MKRLRMAAAAVTAFAVLITGSFCFAKTLEPPMNMMEEGEMQYWFGFGADVSDSESVTDGECVINASDLYYLGLKAVDGEVYPYIKWGGDGSDGTIVEKEEFGKSTDFAFESFEGLELLDVPETTSVHPEDLTRMRKAYDATKSEFVYKSKNVSEVKLTFFADSSITPESIVEIYASADKESWQKIDQSCTKQQGGGWPTFTFVSEGNFPKSENDGTVYIKIKFGNYVKSSGATVEWYNAHLAKMETKRAADPSEQGTILGETALDFNAQYRIVGAVSAKDNSVSLFAMKNDEIVSEISNVLAIRPNEEIAECVIANTAGGIAAGVEAEYQCISSADTGAAYEAVQTAMSNCSYASLIDARALTAEMDECLAKDVCIARLNECERLFETKKALYDSELENLRDCVVTTDNVREKYSEYETLKSQSALYETETGEYSAALETIYQKFSSYLIYLNSFRDDFNLPDGSLIDGWYADHELMIASGLRTNGGNVTIPSGESMNHTIFDVDMTEETDNKNKYWIGTDFRLDGDSINGGFAGINVGDLYYGGVKERSGKFYPYIGWGGEGSDGFINEHYDCTTADTSNAFAVSNVMAAVVSSSTAPFYNEDKTRLRRTNAGIGYIVFKMDKADRVSLVFYADSGVDPETIASVYVSSDNLRWTRLESDVTVSGTGGWKQYDIVTTSEIPADSKYIKIEFMETKKKKDGSVMEYYNINCARMTIRRSATAEELSYVYSDTPLESGKDYNAYMRLSQADNTVKMYVLERDNAEAEPDMIELGVLFRPDEKLNLLTVENGACTDMTVDNIACEMAQDEVSGTYEEKLSTAEEKKTYKTIIEAIDAMENCPESMMKELYSQILEIYRKQNKAKIPQVKNVSFSDNCIAGKQVKAVITAEDSGENLKSVKYEWYIGDELKKTSETDNSYDIPADAVGKTILVKATPESYFGDYGNTAENSENVRTSGSQGGGGLQGGGPAGGGSIKPIQKTEENANDGNQTQKPGISAFADVTYHWAGKEINEMARLGFVNGVGEDEFMPDSNISRAEIAAIVERIGKKKSNSENRADVNYSDVKKNDWFFDSVEFVVNAKIMEGFEDSFNPEESMTREQMAKVVVSLCEYLGINSVGASENIEYSDRGEISDWAVPYVDACARMGIMNGVGDGLFAPKATLTRAEAAVIIYRIVSMESGADADDAQA